MKTRLTMRLFGKYIEPDESPSRGGTPFHYEVIDEHGQTAAWISHWAGDTATWQIQLFKDGFPGEGTGDYATAQEALAVLQTEVDEGA